MTHTSASTPILVIDQGTTSSRAIIYTEAGEILAEASEQTKLHYPRKGWVEQDPVAIIESVLSCCHKVIGLAGIAASSLAGIGITNQRETTLIWDKRTGKAIYPAIVWQDRRTQAACDALNQSGSANTIQEKTGLLSDPYFSATKIQWILDHVTGARELAAEGHLLFGTVDTWLIWHLTGRHLTDVTNASRTQLFNIHTGRFDPWLLHEFNIPKSLLPEVKACHGDFGTTQKAIFGVCIPVLACVGDQQSSLIGQACLEEGLAKSTLGTGCFLMINTGDTAIKSQHRLLTTIAYKIQGKTCYAFEGSIFNAGSIMQWLRDDLGIMENVSESEGLANTATAEELIFVPAFTGLGAPHWVPGAKGAILGIDRATAIPDIVHAALRAVSFQHRDLQLAMTEDAKNMTSLRVDGGMARNDLLLQDMADMLALPIERAAQLESTALGAFYLVALELGIYKDIQDILVGHRHDRTFTPVMQSAQRERLYDKWLKALNAVILNTA